MWKCLVCFFAIVSLSRGAHGTLAEQMAEMTQLCCNKGTSYARNHTSEECSSSIPPDVPSQFGSLCIFAMDQCCKEYFQKKRDCDSGIDIASTLKRCDTASDSNKNCCDECVKGTTTGTSRGAEVCGVGSRGNSAEELLAGDAYAQCCKKAANGKERHAGGNRLIRHTARPIMLYKRPASSDIASVCEEYAPNELCAHHCIPVPGSYKCECNPGYMLMSDGRNCKEVEKNRCKPRNPCQHKCNDNGVQVKCSCKRGYQLMSDGKSCEDIDECLLDPPVCLQGTQCQNTRGSYKCIPSKRNNNSVEKGQCPPGFARNIHNNACDDIDECELPHPPCPVYSCENTIGAYKCDGVTGDPANLNNLPHPSAEDRCPPGFKTGLNEECEDIDECAIHKDDCNPLSQYCINKRGSFHCQDKVSKHCPPGFKINPINNKCEDINECEDGEDICRPDQICVNVPGEYDCKLKVDESRRSKNCPEGMRIKPGSAACEDIDECVEGTHLCDQYQTCLNTNGSHECHCKLGFELDSTIGACVDINECATDQHNCISESQRCDNTVGSYLCIRFTSCGTGYILHHSTSKCEDIDECALGIHNCARAGPEYQCVNTPGSFRCIRHRPSTTSTTPEPEYEYEYYDVEEEITEGNQSNSQGSGTPKDNTPEAIPTTTPKPEISSMTPSTTPRTHPTELAPPLEVTPQRPEEKLNQPEERLRRPEERPSKPEERLSRPEEGPSRPEEGPSRPEERLSRPDEGPSRPEEQPSRPEERLSRPEERPSRPEERLSTPDESSIKLKETPSTPEEIPTKPEETSSRPEEGLSRPEERPSRPEESSSRPEERPSRPGERPSRPEEKPIRPEERPNRPEERPNRPEESFNRPEERPNRPKESSSRREERPSSEKRPYKSEERPSRPAEIPRSSDESVQNSEKPNISLVDDRLNSILPFDPTDNKIKPVPSYNEPIQPELPKPTEPPRQPEISYSEPKETKPQQPYRPSHYEPRPPEQSTYYQPIEPKSSERPEPNEPDPNGIDFEPYEPKYPETTHIPVPVQEPERPSSPEVIYINVGKETATVEGKKTKDGAVIVDTKNVPKNEWTKINAKPSNCQFGFEMDEYGACFDIDECATNRHSCSGLTEVCRNTMGGYLCDCAPGFRRDLATGVCDLIRTSTSTTTSTTTPTPTASTTKNKDSFWGYDYRPNNIKPFRPWLLCDVGYQLNSTTGKCEDLNECTNGQANCAAVEVCVNTQGGYRCECPPNWKLDEVRHRCVPVRKNEQFPPGYENEPVYPSPDPEAEINHGSSGNKYVEPEYTQIGDRGSVFKCPWGYRLGDDNTCEDINECLTGDAKCGPLQLCTNSPGGYTCSCPRGHRLVADHECEDVDECKLAGSVPICSHNAECINTIGSYKCRCHNGFRSAPANDKVCVDVDECTESRSGSLCQHRCNNVWGGYRCSCHRGYRLNPDNSTCSDVDECTEFKSKILCVGQCLNVPGSYRCTCPSGYRLSEDKRSCIDIDECEAGQAPCAKGSDYGGTNDFCLNTRGGYRCHRIVCPPGYSLQGKHRCTKVDRVCSAGDWNCAHQPTTYSYNFITFVSKLYIPASKVDLFTMRGPSWPFAKMRFQLRLVDVNAPPTVEKSDIHAFLLNQTGNQAVVSLVKSLEGPQSIELELSMEVYNEDQFGGTAVARLYIYVSEYEF